MSVAREEAPYRTVESFQVIGVNILVQKGLWGLGVFPEGSLIRGTLASPLMLLRPLVLDPDFHPFLSVFGGRPILPVWITS